MSALLEEINSAAEITPDLQRKVERYYREESIRKEKDQRLAAEMKRWAKSDRYEVITEGLYLDEVVRLVLESLEHDSETDNASAAFMYLMAGARDYLSQCIERREA